MKTQERNSFVINLAHVLADTAKERDIMGDEAATVKEKIEELKADQERYQRDILIQFKERDDLYREQLDKKDKLIKEAKELLEQVQAERNALDDKLKMTNSNDKLTNTNRISELNGLREAIKQINSVITPRQLEDKLGGGKRARHVLKTIKGVCALWVDQ